MPDSSPMTSASSDADLVQWLDRVGVQDYAALKLLYDACSARLYGLAVRIVNNRDWAEWAWSYAAGHWTSCVGAAPNAAT